VRKLLFVLGLLLTQTLVTPARAEVERPPQFIVLAFDGSFDLERWRDLTEFTAEMNKDADRVLFTFFLSAVGLITDANRNIYQGPRQRRGYSAINFGGSAQDLQKRIEYLNTFNARGHEIASHAVGHFNGASWSAAEWTQEFTSFNDLIDKVGPNNGLGAETKLSFTHERVVGLRAPYLATGAGLYAALKANHFRYDTSRISYPDAWPVQTDGIWQFNLAQLRIAGTRKATLSMDYNFFMAQSGGRADPRRQELFGEQMLQTYLDYFKTNYAGNRAPLHIGHHFTNFQGGIYNATLMRFARTVCGLPEVRCTTYEKLADFMDRLSPETLAAYRKGDFAHAGVPDVKVAARVP
jgi:peptidoglycan/xylan/chitin deacetylase (PgdA/CDA1 family)